MKILAFPEFRQDYCWDCGAKAMQALLVYYGIDIREQIIMKLAGTTKRGTLVPGMRKVVKNYKLKYQAGKMTIKDVRYHLARRRPVILLLQAWTDKKKVFWEKDWVDGHYVVAIGYDRSKIYFEDPSAVIRTYLTDEELRERWHHLDPKGKRYLNWGLVVLEKSHYYPKKIIHMD